MQKIYIKPYETTRTEPEDGCVAYYREDYVRELEQLVQDYKEVNEDKKRLTRDIDIIINGDNAAQQASLCDIVGDIKALVSVEGKLKQRIAELERELAEARESAVE